jgi:hypothetical protein
VAKWVATQTYLSQDAALFLVTALRTDKDNLCSSLCFVDCERGAQTALEAGGAVTIEELLAALRTPTETHMEPWRRMAAHLERIGGAVPRF